MERGTDVAVKTEDDIEIQTSKREFSEKTTIYIRERKSDLPSNSNNRQLVTISNTSIELQVNNRRAHCAAMSGNAPPVSHAETKSKWGKVPGYRTPQDTAKMPACVLHQLSHDKRFEQLRNRSRLWEQSGGREGTATGVAVGLDGFTERGSNLFNADFNFVSNKEHGYSLGRSLIDSIRNTVNKFVKKEDLRASTDNSEWDTQSERRNNSMDLDHIPRFPKETRNATIIPLAEIQSKNVGPCKFCQGHQKKLVDDKESRSNVIRSSLNSENVEASLSERSLTSDGEAIEHDLSPKSSGTDQSFYARDGSFISDEDSPSVDQPDMKSYGSLKNFDRIPCPRNLLCDQGLHSGRCHQDVRSKLSGPVCKNDSCVCKKTDSLNDLKTGIWSRRAVQVPFPSNSRQSSNEEAIDDNWSAVTKSEVAENECRTRFHEGGAGIEGDEMARLNIERDLFCLRDDTDEETESNFEDNQSTATSSTQPRQQHCCHSCPFRHRHPPSTMNGINGHSNHHHQYSNNHHSNGDSVNGSGGGSLCGGDIITQNQQKGCWTIGLINSKFRYLTAESFGFKINGNGASLKKKQIWTLEPVNSNSSDSLIYLRSHLDKYLAVDSFGNVTCESEEKDPGSKFQISVADDGSGRWALKNVVRGYFLGSSADKLTCTAKVPGDAEFWHVHLAARPQMNLRSVGRKRFAHLSENLDEIHVDANIPWGEDTLFTLEFRLDESGKYAIHTCNSKYLSLGGKLVDQCTKDCLFSAEYHSGQLALRDRAGSYLSPIGSKAVLKTRSNTVTRDELFSLEDSLPQASFVANLNARFVSVKQGVDVTANQDEISDHETFQLEFDWTTKRWYIRTMQDRYWTLETGGGIQASGDKRSSNALFDLAWQQDGSVAFRANNGRYVITKRSGHLYATADAVEDNSKYYFYLINRPILVLKCEQGFVGYKSAASNKLECNKATYECIQVERGDKGVVYLKGQNGKYWHVDSEGVTADSDSLDGFHLELREPTRLCIKSTAGSYLTASKNGLFRLGDSSYESATQWEY